MTRTMYDGVTSSSVPAVGEPLVAGYTDGLFANLPALKKRFPHARIVGIAVTASYHGADAHVLDVEAGDATPAQAPGWVTAQRKLGVDPTVYCNTSTWPQVKAAFTAARVAQPHYWIAHYGVAPTIPAGAVALQYRNTSGYDESVVADYWPGVDPKPVPPKPKVSLKHIIAAAEADPKGKQGHTTYPADVRIVEAALHAGGYLAQEYATDGSFGSKTVAAYSAWQRAYSKAHHLGWTGAAVNGIPGKTSLTALGSEHGFTVTA